MRKFLVCLLLIAGIVAAVVGMAPHKSNAGFVTALEFLGWLVWELGQ